MNVPQYLYGSNDELQRYFALLVQAMQGALSNNGWTVPQLTATEVTKVTNGTIKPYFSPVMPMFTLWGNTTIGKLQFITVPAVPGVSNATIETITSA
jgi:hypothetical protein